MVKRVKTPADTTLTVTRRLLSYGRPMGMLCVAAGAVFLLLSLISYDPADPSLNNAIYSTYGNIDVNNLAGPVGAYIAGPVVSGFGYAAFLLPVVLLFVVAQSLLKWNPLVFGIRLGAGLSFVLVTSVLLAMIWPQASSGWRGALPGGWIGDGIGHQLVWQYFRYGGFFLVFPMWLLALLAAGGEPLLRALQRLGLGSASVTKETSRGFVVTLNRWLRERHRKRKEAIHAKAVAETRAAAAAEEQKASVPSVVDNGDETASTVAVPAFLNTPGAAVPKVLPSFAPEMEDSVEVPKSKRKRGKKAKSDIPSVDKELEIVMPPKVKTQTKAAQMGIRFEGGSKTQNYVLPSTSFLDKTEEDLEPPNEKALRPQAQILEAKLADFGVHGEVVAVRPGPVVTVFEFMPAPGIKVSRIANLDDDLAMALSALSVRIEAPIPGKNVVGIEIPNKKRVQVSLRSILESDEFVRSKHTIPMALGKDISGLPVVVDLAKMPHLLVAGATGQGKSVGINTMVMSMLYRFRPDELKLFMVDPKRLELSLYADIPHLGAEVVTDPRKAVVVLQLLVKEMEERYDKMSQLGVRSLSGYNQAVRERLEKGAADESDGYDHRPLPLFVAIVDELADLMMVAGREVEAPIARLAQMARAAGIHLVLATQRPSVDVLTGLIKANFPARISFKVSSKADSRTILDRQGPENLLGKGDMLFIGAGVDSLKRIQGAFVSEQEIGHVIDHIKDQAIQELVITDEVLEEYQAAGGGVSMPGDSGNDEAGELYDRAVRVAVEEGEISISRLQRLLGIGYNRAATLMDQMQAEGVVGPPEGAGKRRKVLVQNLP